MNTQSLAPATRASLRSIRSQTLQLFDLATSDDVLRSAPMPGFRPLLWHLAHIGVYQNYWVLQRFAGQPSINPKYDIHFDPIKTPREEAPVLPSRAEIESYLDETLKRVEAILDSTSPNAVGGDGLTLEYVHGLVTEHELQHQETVAFVLQSLPLAAKRSGPLALEGRRAQPPSEILVPGTHVTIGGSAGGFVYDNELPRHEVDVASFAIDRDLVTNAEFADFIEHGGYRRRECWSDAGWEWKEREGIQAPLYWNGQPWRERTFFAETSLRADAPVTGVSWYEADAYARFCGKRLPTETEWEVAAGWDPALAKLRRYPWGDDPIVSGTSQRGAWGTSPVGSAQAYGSALGMNDAIGNLWQWTSSEFRGYPGFVAYPYPEYSQAWFDGDHYVARGGSWFSDASLARVSFRNFYRRHFRPAFLGIRCARNAR